VVRGVHTTPQGRHVEFAPLPYNYSSQVLKVPDLSPNFTSVKLNGSPEVVLHAREGIRSGRSAFKQNHKLFTTACAVDRRMLADPSEHSKPADAWNACERSSFSVLWEPPRPPPTRIFKAPPPPVDYEYGDPFAKEIDSISTECEFPAEQTRLLYKAFQRVSAAPGRFTLPEFQVVLARWGLTKGSVVTRLFTAVCPPNEFTITYPQALRAMCAFGVGTKAKQANMLFRCCDEDGQGLVSRSELLKFIAGSLPDDSGQHKTETFARVGKVFLLLDEDGSGEINVDEWVSGISSNTAVYEAFQTMNPYRQFFKYWNERDLSLQNLLTAAYFSDNPYDLPEPPPSGLLLG